MRFTLMRIFVVIGMIALMLGILRMLTHAETGRGVASVDWLPATASNVSYYKSYLNTAYEFDISEANFVRWSRWKLQPITTPVEFLRCTYFLRDPSDSGLSPTVSEAIDLSHIVQISNGLFYEERQPNGGGVEVAFDRDTGRAYFHSSPR